MRARAAAALLGVIALLGIGLLVTERAATAPGLPRPNVVLIQTDDQTLAQLYATIKTPAGLRARVMPNTLDLIGRRGVTFNNYYVSYPLCCPSRTTLLSGRYAHDSGVRSNDPPDGGYPAFRREPVGRHNLATWLQDAGYRTIHIGKWLNNYGGVERKDSELEVPPGWTEWQTLPNYNSEHLFYGYDINHNGTLEGPFGDIDYNQTDGKDPFGCPDSPPEGQSCDYGTDVLNRRTVEQIDVSAPGRPFYLQLDYVAPHGDFRPPIGPEPAARHYDSASLTRIPRQASFNEADISDKPSFIRDKAELLGQVQFARMRRDYQKSLESLRSVDEGVKMIVDALRRSGELDNTYIFFLSDNGFFFGEHRLEYAKFLPYEEAIHMPLVIRGPGIEPRSQTGELTANTDIAPTILDVTGTKPDRGYDGRSLVPFWEDTGRRTARPILLESFIKATTLNDAPNTTPATPSGVHGTGAGISIRAPAENYLGVRLGPYMYVEYETGDRELYDVRRDPYQLDNKVRAKRYDRIQYFLRRQIRRLEGCTGKACRYQVKRIPRLSDAVPRETIGPPPPVPASRPRGR